MEKAQEKFGVVETRMLRIGNEIIRVTVIVPGKEGLEDGSGGGWITPGTTCRRDNCHQGKGKTGLNGAV